MYGSFGFVADESNRVIFVSPTSRAQAAGIEPGDLVRYDTMPLNDHYQERFAPIGRTVTFRFERGAVRYSATLTAQYHREQWIWVLWPLLWRRIAALILIVVGSALVLIRPTPLSWAFFVYAIGSTLSVPYFFSFLPMAAYFAIMMVSDALFAARSFSFLWLGLNLGPKHPRPWATYVPLAGFGITFSAVAIADVFLMLLGRPAGTLYDGGQLALQSGYALGIPALIVTASTGSMRRDNRVAASWLAVAGAFMFVNLALPYIPFGLPDTSAARIFLKTLNEAALIANLIASLIVAYVIVRGRIVDTGLVVSQTLWYGAIVLSVISVLAAINWAFAPQLAAFPFAIPVEIVAAIAIGYSFSGFRDVANALALATIDAPVAAIEGRMKDERSAFIRALGLAERTRRPGLIAEIRARFAFSAWFWGDDDEFGRQIEGLRSALGPRSLRGLRTFYDAATTKSAQRQFAESDLPEWRARALLVTCGATDDVQLAQQCARDASTAADDSGLPFLRVLAIVARAELVASERETLLDDAYKIAEANAWPAVCKSLQALRSDARDLGMLQAFVDERLLKLRPERPALEILFFSGEVRALGARVDLPDKELELLFTVASSRTPMNGNELLDALWPDADGDLASGTFRVCLHRLRRHIGDPRVVRRVGQAYVLHPGAAVDLWKLQDALTACERSIANDELDELGRLYAPLRDGSGRRAMLGIWFAPFERMLAHRQADAERFLILRDRDELTVRRRNRPES
jgi:hypothetical protein